MTPLIILKPEQPKFPDIEVDEAKLRRNAFHSIIAVRAAMMEAGLSLPVVTEFVRQASLMVNSLLETSPEDMEFLRLYIKGWIKIKRK